MTEKHGNTDAADRRLDLEALIRFTGEGGPGDVPFEDSETTAPAAGTGNTPQ